MDGPLRKLTPIVLLALAVLVWFEPTLMPASFKESFGATGFLRFVLGLVCLYTMFLVIERQRMEVRFTQVLAQFKAFYDQRAGAQSGDGGGGGEMTQEKSLEAVSILAAALSSGDPEVVESAYLNLKRLTGEDYGRDAQAWQAWVEAAKNG